MKNIRKSHGFTLIETLVVMAIVGTLIAIAAPSMKSYLAGQKVKTAAHDLAYTVLLARSEALKRACQVSITPSGSGWKDGWIVRETLDNWVLSTQPPYDGIEISGPASQITFMYTGRPQEPVAPFTVTSSDATGVNAARCVSISPTGLVTTKNGPCA